MSEFQVYGRYELHEPDYENYYYFSINLITHTVPEPTPATYLQRLSQRVPEIEYLGPSVHLDDALQIRVKKSDDIDLLGLIDGFGHINGVASAELQRPTTEDSASINSETALV